MRPSHVLRKSAKLAAICVTTALVLSFALVLAEGLGYFQGTLEHADQAIENALASPSKPVVQDTMNAPATHLSSRIVPSTHLTPAVLTANADIWLLGSGGPIRLKKGLALFDFYSAYRI